MTFVARTTVRTRKKSFKSSRTGFALWVSFLYPLIAQAATEIHFYENDQQLKLPSYRNSFQHISIKNSIVKSPILRVMDLSLGKTDFDDMVEKVKSQECYQKSQTIFLSSKEGFVFKGEHDFDDKNVMISSPIWESNSQSSTIKTRGVFYAIGDRDKRYPSGSLSINAGTIYLENIGFYGLLHLDALEVFFLDSSNIGGRGLEISGQLTVNQDVDLICQNIDLKGDMDNKGTIRVFDKLDMKGKNLKNGSGNDKKGIIEVEEFFFRGDGDSKLDNLYGSISASKTLECDVEEITCGDCIAKKAVKDDPNVLLGLGFVKGQHPGRGDPGVVREHVVMRDGYGDYCISNGSLMRSLGEMRLKASKKLVLHYGHVKSIGKMTLESSHMQLLTGSIEGKSDIHLNVAQLFLERKDVKDICIGTFVDREEKEWRNTFIFGIPAPRKSRETVRTHYNTRGQYPTSLESYIHSEGNIFLNKLNRAKLMGSSIKAKGIFYLQGNQLNGQGGQINLNEHKNIFNLLPYEGLYTYQKLNSGFQNRLAGGTSFSFGSEIKCDGALIINDNHLDLDFDRSVLQANRVEINAQALQGNNSVLINQENPRNDSINVGEDYFEVKIEGENKRKIKKQLESMENICGTSKDNPILVVDMEHLSKG
jgi:hypothetical protein